MKYKITNKNNKEWNGKPFVEADLDDGGDEVFKVSAWNNEFAGDYWEGELEKNDKGYWRIKKPKTGNPNFRTQQMEKVMDRKEQSIGKTMDRKEESIALAGAQRDAVLIVTRMFPPLVDDNQIKTDIIKWRNWFLSDDFRDTPPF